MTEVKSDHTGDGAEMKRGRPSDDYLREDFRTLVCQRRDFLKLSLVALAELARVNRGTLSQILRGQRPCGRTDRAALIHALGLGSRIEEQFLPGRDVYAPKPELILLDPPTSPHPPLERGQRHLICAVYSAAIQEFISIFRSAADSGDYVLQADAAARLAWAYYEMGAFDDSLKWVAMSIKLIETHIGAGVSEIIESVRPGSHSAVCAPSEEVSHVLSRALQIRCKLLVERIVYHQEHELRINAEKAFARTLALDQFLQIPAQLGHDLRWQAVLLASGMEPLTKDAERLLSASREKFPRGSLGDAYLARDRGVVCWLSDRQARARDSLLEAIDSLSLFADARALGPTFCVLSKVISQGGGDRRVARRYALAGAVLHPYGFVLGNAREHLQNVSQLGLQRDIEDLLAGKMPFDVLTPVIARLTNGSPRIANDRIEQNLARVLGTGSELRTGNGNVRSHRQAS
jgi:transcriptional regulator with XRE-family HTH domain